MRSINALSALWRGGRWKGTFSSPFHLPNRTRTFPRAFPPSFVAYFASRRDVNFNFAGLRALSHTPTNPLRELNILEGEIAGDIVTFIGKLVKEPNTNIALWCARSCVFPSTKKNKALRFYWGRCRENIFFSFDEMYNRRKVMPSLTCFWLKGMPIFCTLSILTICRARATSAFQGIMQS